MKIFRSLLYVPADKPRMIENARQLGCDAVIFDLEDAVSLSHKMDAQQQLQQTLAENPFPKPYLVRVNPLHTPFFFDDIETIAQLKPVAIILAKADEQSVAAASNALTAREVKRGTARIKSIPLIESAKAVESIARFKVGTA